MSWAEGLRVGLTAGTSLVVVLLAVAIGKPGHTARRCPAADGLRALTASPSEILLRVAVHVLAVPDEEPVVPGDLWPGAGQGDRAAQGGTVAAGHAAAMGGRAAAKPASRRHAAGVGQQPLGQVTPAAARRACVQRICTARCEDFCYIVCNSRRSCDARDKTCSTTHNTATKRRQKGYNGAGLRCPARAVKNEQAQAQSSPRRVAVQARAAPFRG